MRLGDFVTLKRGYDLPERLREDGEIPVIASAGHTGTHSTAKLNGPGVVTGRYGTIGRVFFVDEPYWPLNTTLYVSDFKGADPRFVYYFLHSIDFDSVSAKSAVPGIDRNDLHEFVIKVPPTLAEQRRIAQILASLDEKIQHNAAIASTLDALAEAIFRRDVFRYAEASELPAGWEFVSVRDVAAINQKSHSAKSHPDQIDYIDIANTGIREINSTTSLAWSEAPSRARRVVSAGDTLVSTVRPERRSMVFVPESRPGLTASTGFAVVTPVAVPASLLYRVVTSDETIARLTALATGAAYPAVNPREIGELVFPLPPDGGKAFDQLVAPLEHLRWSLLEESRDLRALRDALLPRLISGDLEVAEDLELMDSAVDAPALTATTT